MTALSAGFVAGAGPGDVQLRVLATTDLHACLMPHDYLTDQPLGNMSLARTALLIAEARAEATNSLLLDNGDFLQGTPLGDYLAQAPRRRGTHPVIAALNALGYDAGTLGNHEFNFGLDFLDSALAGAAFPVVSANIARRLGARPEEDTPLVPPYVILDRVVRDGADRPHTLRIGIIGFAPPQTLQWDRQHLAGHIVTRDIIEAAQAWVPRIRAEGADVVVALCHSGIGPLAAVSGMENAATALAALPGIDAIVAGHSHLAFPTVQFPSGPGVDPLIGCLAGKPAVMPGHSGSHLGVIDLALRKGPAGWQVLAHAAALRSVAELPRARTRPALIAASPVRKAALTAHRATQTWARRAIGETAVPLTTHFALVAPSAALRLVAEAQRAHIREALRGTADEGLPILSAVSPFKAGGRGGAANYTHIAPGPLALRHAADLYVFPNQIAALRLSGRDLHLWLDRAAGQFHTVAPGAEDADLVQADFPSFNFDQIDGLTYQIDLSSPPVFDSTGQRQQSGSRIRNLCWQGKPLNPEARFVLATNSYRANGSGGFCGARPEQLAYCGPHLVRDILRDHIQTTGVVAPVSAANWGFAPQPGTSVVFRSHPQASPAAVGLKIEPLDLDAGGFRRFRLRL